MRTRLRSRLSEFRNTRLLELDTVPAISRAACRHIRIVNSCQFTEWSKPTDKSRPAGLGGTPQIHTSIFRSVKNAGFCWMASPISLALVACRGYKRAQPYLSSTSCLAAFLKLKQHPMGSLHP